MIFTWFWNLAILPSLALITLYHLFWQHKSLFESYIKVFLFQGHCVTIYLKALFIVPPIFFRNTKYAWVRSLLNFLSAHWLLFLCLCYFPFNFVCFPHSTHHIVVLSITLSYFKLPYYMVYFQYVLFAPYTSFPKTNSLLLTLFYFTESLIQAFIFLFWLLWN